MVNGKLLVGLFSFAAYTGFYDMDFMMYFSEATLSAFLFPLGKKLSVFTLLYFRHFS